MTTADRAFLLVLLSITIAALWPMRSEICDVSHVAFLDDDGLDNVPLPASWDPVDVWTTLAQIEALPEAVRV